MLPVGGGAENEVPAAGGEGGDEQNALDGLPCGLEVDGKDVGGEEEDEIEQSAAGTGAHAPEDSPADERHGYGEVVTPALEFLARRGAAVRRRCTDP